MPPKRENTFQVGILGIDAASEGPISKKHNSSYIFNYRYSTTSLLKLAGNLDYQDLNFKLNFPTKKAGTFSIWGTGLIDKYSDDLEKNPDKLANILDYILYESKNKFVTPKEEIEFAKDLIEVNKIKLSPLFELTVKTKIDETSSLYSQKILAPLISIDLIENAFKHADLQSPDAYISIVFEFKDNVFSLIVSNKISPKMSLKKEKGGIGAISFEQRLNILYKGCFELERLIDDDAFIARLKIDLNEYKTKMFNS